MTNKGTDLKTSLQIKLSDRFIGYTYQRATMVVDGIDFRIQEPRKNGFNKNWYSHKFRKPAIRYEVATCINTGHIVWMHGPFPAGSCDDKTIYQIGLKQHLLPGEKVWADGGYRGDLTVIHKFLPSLTTDFRLEHRRGRARHETLNGRFTDWSALRDVYRHDLNKHHLLFDGVVIITQLEMRRGFIPFQCSSFHDPAF
jgi:hypothetical protein